MNANDSHDNHNTTRRQFLAATAVAGAGAIATGSSRLARAESTGLPPITAEIVTASVEPPATFFFAALGENSSGALVPHNIFGTLETAQEYNHQKPIRRYKFRPMESAYRYRIVEGEWLSETNPRSAIDLPEGLSATAEHVCEQAPLLTREQGLAEVAHLNSFMCDGPGQPVHRHWLVLVELGQRIKHPLVAIRLDENGVGKESRTFDYAVRVVRPTADEVARLGGFVDVKNEAVA